MAAAHGGHVASVRVLIEAGASLEKVDSQGETALLHAAMKGHTEVLRVLVEAGADVNASCADGRTVLSEAARSFCVEAVEYLAQRGAKDPNLTVRSLYLLHYLTFADKDIYLSSSFSLVLT